jgi:hydrogen cyanide synthase HcnC
MTRTAEAIVVGGGVIGCAVAYELARREISVALLDKDLPGRATSASAGGLWPVGEAVGLGCGVIYHTSKTEARNGEAGHADRRGPIDDPGILPAEFRELLVASNALFPVLAGVLKELSGIDIEYQPGGGLLFLVYSERDRQFVEHVQRSLPADCHVEMLTPAEAHSIEPRLTPDLEGAALLPGEHQVNPMLLAEAYKRAAIRLGAQFRHDTRVTSLERRGERIVGVEAAGERWSGQVVINAAGAWSGGLAGTVGIELPVFPVRGQIVLTQALPKTLGACLSTSGCYLAQKAHGEVLIGSTTERTGFDVSVTAEGIRTMCRGAVRAVPMLRAVGIKRMWAGLRPGTPDELPILGPVEGLEGYINATGGFRTGIVASPMTARLVAQSIIGEPPELPLEPFLASRFGRTGAPTPAHDPV